MQFSHFSLPADQNALPFVDRLKIIPSYELSIGANKKRLKYVQADVDHFLIVHQKLRKREANSGNVTEFRENQTYPSVLYLITYGTRKFSHRFENVAII